MEAFGYAVAVWENEHPQDFFLPILEGSPEGLEQIKAAGFELFDAGRPARSPGIAAPWLFASLIFC